MEVYFSLTYSFFFHDDIKKFFKQFFKGGVEIFEKRGGSDFFHKIGGLSKKRGITYFHTN